MSASFATQGETIPRWHGLPLQYELTRQDAAFPLFAPYPRLLAVAPLWRRGFQPRPVELVAPPVAHTADPRVDSAAVLDRKLRGGDLLLGSEDFPLAERFARERRIALLKLRAGVFRRNGDVVSGRRRADAREPPFRRDAVSSAGPRTETASRTKRRSPCHEV